LSNPFTVYEERRVLTKPGGFPEYLSLVEEHVWPEIKKVGGQALVLLNGLIGDPIEETLMITGFTDTDKWQAAQNILTINTIGNEEAAQRRSELVLEESVALMAPSPYRPDAEPLTENRRPVYGARRFTIDPADLDDFERYSFEGIWPGMDEMGHSVLGQFHPMGVTDSFAVLNLAGYNSPAHWYETRYVGDPASGTSDESREAGRTLGSARRKLVKHSFVRLLTSHWPD
jgi:hypothetical protein